ncbi:hypothetical protein WG66_011264 [Moniliophthora roreri]|nr:hypothetical protein WG66_011264 [Moniliophthora roreri]
MGIFVQEFFGYSEEENILKLPVSTFCCVGLFAITIHSTTILHRRFWKLTRQRVRHVQKQMSHDKHFGLLL